MKISGYEVEMCILGCQREFFIKLFAGESRTHG